MAGFPIGFKDPRTARLLRMWQEIVSELGAEARFVVCLRNPAQVARSLTQRDGLPHDTGEYRWFTYMAEVFDQLSNAEICLIEYEQWFADPVANAGKLVRFLDVGERRPAADLPCLVADILDNRLSHDDPAFARPELAMVAALHDAAHRLDTDPAVRGEIAGIVDRFEVFRQLHRPIDRDFEALSGAILKITGRAVEDASRPIVSWRDPRVAAVLERLEEQAAAAGPERAATAPETAVNILLRQRAELDATLARAQQAASLHRCTAQVLARELAAARAGATAATASLDGSVAPIGSGEASVVPPSTAVAIGQPLTPPVARGAGRRPGRAAGRRSGRQEHRTGSNDPESAACWRRGCSRPVSSSLHELRGGGVSRRRRRSCHPTSSPVCPKPGSGFRYDPTVRHTGESVLWTRPANRCAGAGPMSGLRCASAGATTRAGC